jgi:streptogramin lyase
MPSPRLHFCHTTMAVFLAASLSFASLALASTDFVVPPGRSTNPYSIVVGPDKNLWFTESGGEKIGRITTSGVITQFPIPGAQSLLGLTSGPDGNLWFTDQLTGKIGHISTSGTGIKEFALPKGSFPQGITAGPDGNLWFVEQKQNGFFKVGKITVSGAITEYATNVNVGIFQAYPPVGNPAVITAGPDGNLWVTNSQNLAVKEIWRISTDGTITPHPTKDYPLSVAAGPDGNLWATESAHVAKITTAGAETEYAITSGGWSGICTGPDGNIWFTEVNNSIDFVTPAGVVTENPSLFPTLYYFASLITGPDGAFWFPGSVTSNIGRITTGGQLTTYALSTGSVTGFDALGPDGNVWFTELIPSLVGKITPTGGVITTYPTLSPNANPGAIAAGGDGNLWFIEQTYGQIAKITPSGTVTEYPLKGTFAEIGVTSGPDGNVWYTVPFTSQGPSVARITPAGVITLCPLSNSSAVPLFITTGPDGNLWFTDLGTDQIGMIDPLCASNTEYQITTKNANPSVITAGPDGNLWFLENTPFGAVAKITTSGTVTEYPAQFQNFQDGIVAAPDGAIWFAQCYPNGVDRITTSGVLSNVTLTTPNACGNALTVGSDDKLWVAEGFSGAIGRLSAIGGTGKTIKPTHGEAFKGAVGSFKDGAPSAIKSDFTASVNWGDNGKSAGTVSGPMGGPFSVSGTHTYAKSGKFKLIVTLTDKVDKSTYTASPGEAMVK